MEPKPQPNVNSTIDLKPVKKSNWKTPASRELYKETLASVRKEFPLAKVKAVNKADNGIPATIVRDDNNDILKFVMNTDDLYGNPVRFQDVPTWFPNSNVPGNWYAVAESETKLGKLIESITGCGRASMDAMGISNCCQHSYKHSNHERPIYESGCGVREVEPIDDNKGEIEAQYVHDVLNPIWAGLGIRLIDFVPCRLDCDDARERAIEHGKQLREIIGDEKADKLFDFLRQPAKWDAYNGLVHITNREMIGSYETDSYFDKRVVVWKGEHQPKR